MIRRRELFGVAAASVAAAKAMSGEMAQAADAVAKSRSPAQAADAMQKLAGIVPRGFDGRLKRLPSLDLESQQDYTLGLRLLLLKQIRAASLSAFDRVLEAEGIDPSTPLSAEEVRVLAVKDPAINIGNKTWLQNQIVTWKTLHDHFHEHYDYYMSELEAGDKAGPGTLQMSPQMEIPAYARHEIHIQPGGYVADPFAGYVYHYGTNSFYPGVIGMGHNDQDQVHKGAATRLPLPPDGKVRRILDMGCGVGQYTAALKERFPEAEVWGVEIGGPMVRYAHMRATQLGIGANFAQKLAEDTGFPDGYFDIVTSYIMHHEVPAQKTLEIIEEARRITRAGGVYYPLDFNSGGVRSPARAMYSRWMDHRWNNEVWSLEYHSISFTDEIAKRGFTKAQNPVAVMPGYYGVRHFIRNA